MKIAIAADHGGYKLKEEIKPYIESLGHTVTDFGTYSEDSVDYPDYAAPCARAVVSGEMDRGIVICGTGIGISIAAKQDKGSEMRPLHRPGNGPADPGAQRRKHAGDGCAHHRRRACQGNSKGIS